MEFAIHNSLPIYAGGLGILAGDVCKETSDMGLPMAGVGFMYPQGYFLQRISAEGWQEEVYQQLNFDEAPIRLITSPDGEPILTGVEMGDRKVSVRVWEVKVGKTKLYLLDTNVDRNSPLDRSLSARLYTADREQRLQQEIVLGVGGVRVLRALGITPSVWHANEGHASFMMLERIREEVQKGTPFSKAVQNVRETTIFTTHTPVPAGHDIFSEQMVDWYLGGYWDNLNLGHEMFLGLGRQNGTGERKFNMTALGMRAAGYRNGVSKLHGEVTRRMWHGLWPDVPEDQAPINHITNGVHVPTWIGREMAALYDKYLGADWIERRDEVDIWQHVRDIPDEELWSVRQILKHKLTDYIDEETQRRWAERRITAAQCMAMGALFNPETLTIGIVRRFAEYKRPELLFEDIEHLKRIVQNSLQPVQIIFAGKAHPADFPAKQILHDIYTQAMNPDFQGRIAFVENYDMHIAHYLTQGVDVWLNMPRRLHEACGTSGMKAALNGVPHCSICDGWWCEGYNDANGWVIGEPHASFPQEEQDKIDAEALYRLLEERIVPLYYERDRNGVPHGWMRLVKEAISSIAPVFCARRMMKEYVEKMYLPTAKSLETTLQVKNTTGI
ncbi:MAG: alpha-glucan family phosphorylase [Chloroflexota bacterium]